MPKMITALTTLALLVAPSAPAQDAEIPSERELNELLEQLRVPDVAWRQIPWKSCLLDGLVEAQRTGRPLMFWCQIDRPFDDTRC
jgi:hypothetical protein